MYSTRRAHAAALEGARRDLPRDQCRGAAVDQKVKGRSVAEGQHALMGEANFIAALENAAVDDKGLANIAHLEDAGAFQLDMLQHTLFQRDLECTFKSIEF